MWREKLLPDSNILEQAPKTLSFPIGRHLHHGDPSLGVGTERRRSIGLFFFHKKGALAFFGQRALGKSIRLLSCPYAANPTIMI